MSSERASVPVKTTDAVTFDTTDALPLNTPVRPYTGLLVPCVRTRGYTSRFDTTDARPCVPTAVTRIALTGTDAQIVRPYTGLLVTCVPTYSYTSVSLHGEQTTACGRTNHSPQSEEQSSERLGEKEVTRSKRPPLCGRSDWNWVCNCKLRLVRPTRGRSSTTFAYPSVVRGCAPPIDGYDASDLLRGPFSQGSCMRD